MNNNEMLATVDLGSNSFRVLIAKVRDDGIIVPVDQIKETVRLAGGLDSKGFLSPEAQSFAWEVLSRFGERLAGFSKKQVRVVGTSTLRVAKNAEDFIDVGNKKLGFKIEVISGNEEARLIYIGATHSLEFTKDNRLVIDIGGGSTEFIIGSGYDPIIMESVTMGCVSFSNRYFPDGILDTQNFDNAIFAACGKIQAMEHLFTTHTWSYAVGTSGTSRALYDLCIEHGFADQITLSALYKIRKLLQKSINIKNLASINLKEDRRPVIAGGLSIMIAVMEEFSIESMTISDSSLREGVMYDLLGRTTNHDLRISTVNTLKKRYEIDEKQADKVAATTQKLFIELSGGADKIEKSYLKPLQWACELYEIGLSISHNDYHKHGAYILANADMAGFSKPEQSLLAELVKTHRGNLVKAIGSLKETRRIKQWLLYMILSFRFSVIFNRNRTGISDNVILGIKNISKNNLEFSLDKEWLKKNPLKLYSIKEEIEQWSKVDIKISIV
jgi:exopolyphosphatase / guanosine-5'-triphosphate,3'-diphosphate pyrophosphatase